MMPEPLLQFKRLSELAVVPAYQSEHAAGLDLHAATTDPVEIPAGEIEIIPVSYTHLTLPTN